MSTMTPAMSTAAVDIKKIHIAKAALGMDDDTYRALIGRISQGRTTSSKTLTDAERQAVLVHMRKSGFVLTPRQGTPAGKANGWRRTPEMTKLRALWWQLADAGAVTRPQGHQACDDAIDAWAVRQLSTQVPPLAAVRFASGEQMQTLIEALKQWLRRVRAASPTRAAAQGGRS